MSTSKSKPKPRARKSDADLEAFARHFAEVLRIARTSDLFTSRFYNDIADAWCDFENETSGTQAVHDSEEFILSMLRLRATRVAARKGGAS